LALAATATKASASAWAKVAARLSDLVIVTDDNPRSEDPAAIRRAVLAGRPTQAKSAIAAKPSQPRLQWRAVATSC
jgi:hypothetical protein